MIENHRGTRVPARPTPMTRIRRVNLIAGGALTVAALLGASADGCEENPPQTSPQRANQPHATRAAAPSPTATRQRSAEVVGTGWVGETEDTATSYQLELATGPYTSYDITVSAAVYYACDIGEWYPRCAKGARR